MSLTQGCSAAAAGAARSLASLAADRRRRALFVVIPAIGHASPLLLRATELAARGWQTALASTSELAYVDRMRSRPSVQT